MKRLLLVVIIALLANMLTITNATSQQLRGKTGQSSQWKSGWIDLRAIIDFNKGDTLIIKVGGTATKILVRLLSRGDDPNSPSGIEGDIRKVPANRIIKVVLESDYKQVQQISVHGGPDPFGYSLGQNNGAATLVNVRRISHSH